MTKFEQYIGIDYSGAGAATSRLKGMQVAEASVEDGPTLIRTPQDTQGRGWNWTRCEIAEWLIERARLGCRFLVGIDHAFSFPHSYFQRYELTSWQRFLDDFVEHWPTDQAHTYVDFIRDCGVGRTGERSELRLTERWTSSAKSVFAFDVQGQVAKSTHAGIPWLRRIRDAVGEQVHFWPFDGWRVSDTRSVLVEVYPSIVRNRRPRERRTIDEQDAYSTARWLQEIDGRVALDHYLMPPLTDEELEVAELEGWILGIT
jgi:hypothetical protein